MEVEFRELVDQEIQSLVLVKFINERVDREILDDIKDVLRISLNIVVKVDKDIGGIRFDSG